MRRIGLALIALALFVAACAAEAGDTSLEIETRTGYAVIVEETADALSIGFSADRDAAAGEAFDVTQSVWRIDDGPWNEPPVTCLGRGQRVQLGIAQVENESRPGLLKERVVWLVCLAPE